MHIDLLICCHKKICCLDFMCLWAKSHRHCVLSFHRWLTVSSSSHRWRNMSIWHLNIRSTWSSFVIKTEFLLWTMIWKWRVHGLTLPPTLPHQPLFSIEAGAMLIRWDTAGDSHLHTTELAHTHSPHTPGRPSTACFVSYLTLTLSPFFSTWCLTVSLYARCVFCDNAEFAIIRLYRRI